MKKKYCLILGLCFICSAASSKPAAVQPVVRLMAHCAIYVSLEKVDGEKKWNFGIYMIVSEIL